MANASVFTPLFDDDAVRSVNFFNGRLLSGEDLTTQKRADRSERRRLGRAVGAGVVQGFVVQPAPGSTGPAPAVSVSAGLAIDRDGDTVYLPNDAEVSLLALRPAAAGPSTVDAFRDCKPPDRGTYVTGAGVYLLTVSRAAGSSGFAPVSGLGNEIAGCNRKYLVEGVEFRLAQVPVGASTLAAPARLRNTLAYACFETAETAGAIASVFEGPSGGGDVIAAMRKAGSLADCEVPLALVYWTASGIQFIDVWAVRRRPAEVIEVAAAAFLDPVHVALAEARLLQFQAHLAEMMRASPDPAALEARAAFTYLPPAAFLPITGVREDGAGRRLRPAASTARALNYERFFGDRMKAEPRVIEGARVGPLLRESLSCPPIDLAGDQMFWLYAVRENMQAVERGDSQAPYLIVASPHLRYQAEARFDVSYSNYANFL